MTQGVMFLPPAAMGLIGDERRQRPQQASGQQQPLAPWFLDIPALRSARFDTADRERRFRLQLEKLMELFSSSQIEPAEFRERLVALMSSR